MKESTDILKKACSYCIYQERTQAEVREKLKSWGLSRDHSEEVIAWLITENFLNEGRYARQFAGGKFRVKKWGRRRILFELKAKGISAPCIRDALSEIPEEDYRQTLHALAEKKAADLHPEKDPFVLRKKITTYLLMKGYEPELISDTLRLPD